MARRRVLIVEDEPDVRRTLADIVRAMRHAVAPEIEAVPDGEQGLNAILRQLPDLVLLNLHLPRLSGLELLKQIRRVAPHLPVIVVTATQDTEVAAAALRAGAAAYLPKPFDGRYVETLVATFLGTGKPRPPPAPKSRH